MASNFGIRLGQRIAEKITERFIPRPTTEEAPAQSAPPTEGAAPSEATSTTEADPVAPPAPTVDQPTPQPVQPAEAAAEPTSSIQSDLPTAPPPTATVEPVEAVPELAVTRPDEASPADAAPAAPEKSAEELEEERLWSETDRAWAAGDFGRVTELLDQLKILQPEDAAEIDQKIAAALYNAGSQCEQAGELARALYLYEDAQRRNPNLGEASFAIERVRNQLAAAARPAESAEAPAAPAAQTYTVQAGDSLWGIAERFYGNGSEWNKIFEANRDQIENPDLIHAGQVLTIP